MGLAVAWHRTVEDLGKYHSQGIPMVSALARVRRSLGTTQTEVADALGVGQPAVSNLERRHDPKVSTLAAWATALGGRLRITLDVNGEEFALPIGALGPRAELTRRPPRRMRVIWQDAERNLRHVGNLTDDGVRYEFAYTDRERPPPSNRSSRSLKRR